MYVHTYINVAVDISRSACVRVRFYICVLGHWWLCVRVCVFVSVRGSVCASADFVCVFVYVCASVFACVFISECERLFVFSFVRMCVVCVYMRMCVRVRVSLCMHVCFLFVCKCERLFVLVFVSKCVVCVCMRMCIHVRVCVFASVCVCVCLFV